MKSNAVTEDIRWFLTDIEGTALRVGWRLHGAGISRLDVDVLGRRFAFQSAQPAAAKQQRANEG